MKTLSKSVAAGLLVTLLAAGTARAEPPAPAIAEAQPAGETQPATAETPFSRSKAAGDDVLDKATAREDLSLIARSQQSSNVSNNSINGASTTGDIQISDNAFQNATGLTIINANSGNNVAMNGSINVNIVMTPPQQ